MLQKSIKAWLLILSILVAIQPALAGPNQVEPGRVTINSGNLSRVYHIHTPLGLNDSAPAPVVFVFHGNGGTGIGAARISHMNKEADKRGFIVVYPDGVNKHWNDGRTDFTGTSNLDDVGFIQDIIKKMQAEMKIDSSRIYACGLSNGGLFSQRLACQLPNIFAAVASVSANALVHRSVSPTKPFPIMFMLGTGDPIMPFKGGELKGLFGEKRGAILSAEETVDSWVRYDRCPTNPVVSTYGQQGAKLSIESRVYSPGADNSEVVFCIVNGGGHCWPGGVQYFPAAIIGQTSPINANEIIWQFFNRHSLSN